MSLFTDFDRVCRAVMTKFVGLNQLYWTQLRTIVDLLLGISIDVRHYRSRLYADVIRVRILIMLQRRCMSFLQLQVFNVGARRNWLMISHASLLVVFHLLCYEELLMCARTVKVHLL